MSCAAPLCMECRHYRNGLKCAAFPRRIPDDIIEGIIQHDHPIKGDHGILFEVSEPFSDFSSVKEDLLTLLPEPRAFRSSDKNKLMECCSGEPPEVIVVLTPTDVRISRCAYFWEGPHELVEDPHPVGTVDWRQPDAKRLFRDLIAKARAQRRRTFRKCRYCGEKLGPEHMHSKDVCQGCAEEHLGIVH